MILWITGLILAHLCQGYFWLFDFRRNLWKKEFVRETSFSQDLPSVAVIIAAKDEAQNLRKHLPNVLDQDYPTYQVIVINDHSTDETKVVLQEFAVAFPNILSVYNLNGSTGKKAALSLGIQQSDARWIVTTDADCKPKTQSWLIQLLQRHKDADLILGYGPYEKNDSWLSKFISYETWYIALQYFSAAANGRAYMGIGRNMAFRKKLFEEVGGYGTHANIKSGDDDLFVQSVSERRVVSETHPDSRTISTLPVSWKALFQQKRRHLTTANSYSFASKFRLSLLFGSQVGLYLSSLVLLYYGHYWVLIPLFWRACYLYFVARPSMKALGVGRIWWWVLFLDFVLVIYYSFQGILMLRPKKDW